MIREQKNKFWLTLILILSLSFSAFALGVANVFSNRKTNPALPVDATTDGTLLTDKVGDPTDMNNNGVTDENLWKKNGSTFVSDIGTIYGGTEISVETASDLNTTANDESWHSALRVRVKGTDGTTPYNNTYQPYIQNGYELVGFYFYAGSTQFGDLFESGEKATTEQIDPAYTGNITIKAVCVPIQYTLSLYYSENGTTWQKRDIGFDVCDETILPNLTNVTIDGNERSFKKWAILTNYVTPDASNNFVTKGGIKFVSDKSIHTAGDGKTYYYITSVQGYSSSKTNDWYTGTKYYSSFNPAIRATWSYVYNGLINNEYAYHVGENVIGAVSSYDVNNADGNYKQAKLKIADDNAGNYKYKFTTNTGTAFYHKNNAAANKASSVNGSYYYVYNYGREITGWQVYFAFGGSNKYLKLEESWGVYNTEELALNAETAVAEVKDPITKEDLNTTKALAKRLDAYFISGYDPNIKIVMKPQWNTVDIEVHVEASKLKSGQTNTKVAATKYNLNYTISDSQVFVSPGQMIYAYKNGENIIAKNHNSNSMPWNYVNITQSQFKYDSGTYKLTVEPVCVDNIYKITLVSKDVALGVGNVYTLEHTQQEINNVNQYRFAIGSASADDVIDITNANTTKKYDHYSSGSIEEYISSKVYPAYTEYNDAITNGTLDILRKVFTTNPKVSIPVDKLGLECTGSTNFYIYLANNKPAGDLPVFKYGYYDLIAWDNIGTNLSGSVKNAYETYKYKTDFHKSEFDSYDCYVKHNHVNDLVNCKKIRNINNEPYWSYSEMNRSMELQAHFFRKNYLLDLNTLREGASEGRYGYILIEINEEDSNIRGTADDKGGKFVAVYDKVESKMQYFDVSNLGVINVNSISTKTAFAFTKSDLMFTDAEGEFVKFYAGCSLTITASCVDYFNGDDLAYVDMVGYYLASINTKTIINGTLDAGKAWFDDIVYDKISDKTNGKHNLLLSSSDIESKNCPNGSKIAINANFAPINYKITISLKTNEILNPFAGRVDCYNKSTNNLSSTITFESVNVESDWSYIVEYLANAGYTLKDNSIIAKNKDGGIHILLNYNKEQNTSDENKQQYLFVLNGEWLIKNYYTTTYDARTNNQQALNLDVNTELFDINYKIEIEDEGGVVLTNYNNGIIKLNGLTTESNIALITLSNSKLNGLNNGKVYSKLSKELIGNEFEKLNTSEDFYVVKILSCEEAHAHDDSCYTNYVVLESWLPYATLGNNNYKIIYEFLLNSGHLTSGDENDILTQSVMNNIFGFGTIINAEDRVLNVKIKVSKLYTITLKAEKHTLPDPCLTDRTTIIKNHDIGFENYTNIGTLITKGSDFNNFVIVYSYKGVQNILSSTYNEVMYAGVAYRLGNSASNIEGNMFTLDETKVDDDGNIEVVVTYIPKPITTFDVTYRLNGVENSSIVAKYGSTNTTNKLIKELTSTTIAGLFFNQYVSFGYELLSNDHSVVVTLNGVVQTKNPFNCVVNEQAYTSGGFFVVIDVVSVKRENATIMYVLEDNETAFADDVYGELDLFVNGSLATGVTMMGNTYVVKVAEGKKLEVDISKMAKGYSFVSLKRASTVLTAKLPASKKITITNSFDFGENNTYFVVIKKDVIRANLVLQEDVIYDYDYTLTTSGVNTVIDGDTKSVRAYLGKTLEFNNVDKELELLDYYYYTDNSGVEHKIVAGADGKLALKLTTEILDQLEDKVGGIYNINFGVKTIKKYKLNYNVVNEIFAESVDVKVGEDQYFNGVYLLNGTTINVNVVAKDNGTEAKYDIILSGCLNKTITTGVMNEEIVLDANKELTITITQKNYVVHKEEYIYNDIESYNLLAPTLSDEDIGSINVDGDVKYNNNVTVRFARVNSSKGELAVIRIRGNDAESLIVHIRGKQITSVYDETNNVEYVETVENVKHSEVTGVEFVEVANLKDKLQEFGYNLTFVSGYGEYVEITYVVKNVIDIKTEYLCYKTIKPII